MSEFDECWSEMAVYPLTGMTALALEVCRKHHLRSADALHLATALVIRDAGGEVLFVCSDGELLAAAKREGLGTLGIAVRG